MEDTARPFCKVKKVQGGFINSEGNLLSCILHFDENGIYIGQEQLNCMDDDPDAPYVIFFKPQGNEAGWLSLTKEEMLAAEVDEAKRNQAWDKYWDEAKAEHPEWFASQFKEERSGV